MRFVPPPILVAQANIVELSTTGTGLAKYVTATSVGALVPCSPSTQGQLAMVQPTKGTDGGTFNVRFCDGSSWRKLVLE